MEISVQLYIPAALHKDGRSPAPAEQEVVWAPENFWTWGLRAKFLPLLAIKSSLPSRKPDILRNELLAFF
jgi:hypothetical protein